MSVDDGELGWQLNREEGVEACRDDVENRDACLKGGMCKLLPSWCPLWRKDGEDEGVLR